MFVDGWNFLMKGGPIMWPLLACAVVAIAVMIERYLVLRRFTEEMEAPLRLLRAGRETDALKEAERLDSPASALVRRRSATGIFLTRRSNASWRRRPSGRRRG